MDTKPIPVVDYRRSQAHSDFLGGATHGHCASRKMKYFGFKLALIGTLPGTSLAYALLPAHTDEREAAEAVLYSVSGCTILSDKGFIG